MRYYIYMENIKQNAVTIYDSEDEALKVSEIFKSNGIDALVCVFGFPYS